MKENAGKSILLLSFYYKPDLCAGSFRASAFAEAFKEVAGENVTLDIVSTMPNRYKTFKAEAKERETDGPINIYRIPLPPHASGFVDQAKSFSKYFFTAQKIIKNKDYDLVISTSSRLFTAFLGARSAKRKKAPLYLDIRDIFTDTMDDVLKNKLLKFFAVPTFKMIERYTMNSSMHINLVSEGFKNYFTERYDRPLSFYTNGIDPDFLKNDFTKTGTSDRKIIAYAGNIGEGQGLHIVIPEAAKALEKDYEFWIIGDGGAKGKLLAELDRVKPNNVKMIGPVDRKKLMEYYRQSDFMFLHLNDFEAFEKVLPSKIFEYAAMGRPIIAGVNGYAAQFLTTHLPDTILFNSGDVNTFVQKLKDFDQDQKVNRDKFIEQFSRSNIMRVMVKDILLKLDLPVKNKILQ